MSGYLAKENSYTHGAKPVHLIITMIKRVRTSRLTIKKSQSLQEWAYKLMSILSFDDIITKVRET